MDKRAGVRARKSPWIETQIWIGEKKKPESGLVRARGLKQFPDRAGGRRSVRARKSLWIETITRAI